MENDANRSANIEIREGSSDSKSVGMNTSTMPAYKDEGDFKKTYSKHNVKHRRKKVSSGVNSISEDISFLPPLQKTSNFGLNIPTNSLPENTAENKTINFPDNLLSASHLTAQGVIKSRLKHEGKETITLEMDVNKETSVRRYLSVPDMLKNNQRITSNYNHQMENAQMNSQKPLVNEAPYTSKHLHQLKQNEPPIPAIIQNMKTTKAQPLVYKSTVLERDTTIKNDVSLLFVTQNYVRDSEAMAGVMDTDNLTPLSHSASTTKNNEGSVALLRETGCRSVISSEKAVDSKRT